MSRAKYWLQNVEGVACILLILFNAGLGLAIVGSVHENSLIYRALQSERELTINLEVQWKKLLLEQSAWQSYARVEQIAREELNMYVPGARDIVVVQAPIIE